MANRLALACSLVVVAALPARAHDADVVYSHLGVTTQGHALVETMTLTADTLRLLAPIDVDGDQLVTQDELTARAKAIELGVWGDVPLTAGGVACTLSAPAAFMRQGFVELNAEWTCGDGELRQDFKILRVLPPNFRVVLGTQLDGEQSGKRFAQGSLSSLVIPRPPPPGAWDRVAFSAGVDAGLRRVGETWWWAAVLALLLVVKGWRWGALCLAALSVGVFGGSWLALGVWPPAIALTVAVFMGPWRGDVPPVLPLLGGLALGAEAGGGSWSLVLGLTAGSVALSLPLGVAALAAGQMLQRRAGTWRFVKWAFPALTVLGLTRLW